MQPFLKVIFRGPFFQHSKILWTAQMFILHKTKNIILYVWRAGRKFTGGLCIVLM